MYAIRYTGKMKKDIKTCQKRNYNLALLEKVIALLMIPEPLQEKIEIIIYLEIMRDIENAIYCRIGYLFIVMMAIFWNWSELEPIQICLINNIVERQDPKGKRQS